MKTSLRRSNYLWLFAAVVTTVLFIQVGLVYASETSDDSIYDSYSAYNAAQILNPYQPVAESSMSIKNDISPTLRSLAVNSSTANFESSKPHITGAKRLPHLSLSNENSPTSGAVTGSEPSNVEPTSVEIAGVGMPLPDVNFAGLSNADNQSVFGYKLLPPDTNGDVGLDHYVQIVNTVVKIWDKQGNAIAGPVKMSSLFGGFGGRCETQDDGDPIVLYDHLADRWMLTQFAFKVSAFGVLSDFHQCIAISQTGDPTGTWYRYDFKVSNNKMNDYPKLGVWPDGYYMSANQFTNGLFWGGAGVYAFERDKMLIGQPAQLIYFDLYSVDPNLGGMLPSDLDGSIPPAGSPNTYLQQNDDNIGYANDALEVWEFHTDWTDPLASTFTKQGDLITASFDSRMCGFDQNCIPQPGATVDAYLDALSDRLMYRLQYRNLGSTEALIVNHTVDENGSDHAAPRWYELHKNGGDWEIYQQGTYAPDSDHRWMGSIAMDGSGNLALGYSLSSSSIFPSIRYTGRLATDPLNSLPQGENSIIAGGGIQTHSASRWGDYSSMSVDPSDNCTFWYTQEYYSTTSTLDWETRIASFKFPECVPSSTDVTLPETIILSATSGTIATSEASFTWTGSDDTTASADLTYSYMLEGYDDDWSSFDASTTKTFSGLNSGAYVFKVRAMDGSGNIDPTPAEAPFSVSIPGTVRFEENSGAIEYSNNCWNNYSNAALSDGNAQISNKTSCSASLAFFGKKIEFISAKAPQLGKVKIYIDNTLVKAVDAYSRNAQGQVVLFSGTAPEPGAHVIKVVVSGQKNSSATNRYVVIDAFDVTN